MKNKIIIFKSKKEHFWYSCRIIEEHILNAFKQSDLHFEVYEWDDLLNIEQIRKLKEEKVSLHFYFLSDYVNHQAICSQLRNTSINGTFYIPVYGNMTVEIKRWLELGILLKDQKVVLIGASHRSCRQIQAFVDAEVVEIPFCFETDIRKEAKEDSQVNLVYAGRLTPQKNILELLQTFIEAAQYNPNLHLHVAGEFDRIKFPLHGYRLDLTRFTKEVLLLIDHPAITFHQNLPQSELLKLFSKSDHFISMSTYHDEDFSMSTCQASVVGLGLVLSDWGGQAAFKENSIFIPVTVNDLSLPQFNRMKLFKVLAGLKKSHNLSNYSLHFSYQTFIQRIKHLVGREPGTFKGLKKLYEEYAQLTFISSPFNNFEKIPTKKESYLAIYRNYLSDK